MIDFLNSTLSNLEDNLPPAAVRLIGHIFSHTPQDLGNTLSVAEIPKPQVFQQLEAEPNGRPSDDTIRQYLSQFRKAMKAKEGVKGADKPSIDIKSQKYSFKVTISEAAVAKAKNAFVAETLSAGGGEDFAEHMGGIDTVSPRLVEPKPTRKVFVSHCWGVVKEHDEILDEFVTQLSGKLKALPDKWRDKFSVELIYDRNGLFHARAGFEQQIRNLCAESHFALFMINSEWERSLACKSEAKHFTGLPKLDEENPFLLIQLTGKRDDLSESYKKLPNLPSYQHKWTEYPNLLSLWEDCGVAARDDFVAHVRDQVCQYLEKIPRRDKSVDAGANPRTKNTSRNVCFDMEAFEPDIPIEKAVEAKMLRQIGADKIDDQNSVPAIHTLKDWACNPEATERLVVLLGGFGMGKTTTVQLLHEELNRVDKGAENRPVPIYLDFRRLIPAAAADKIHELDIADLAHASLHPNTQRGMTSADVIEFMRTENCLVIFDGLDEVGNRLGREAAAHLFRQFTEIVPAAAHVSDRKRGKADWEACPMRMVLTCRTHFFRSFQEQNNMMRGSQRGAPRIQTGETEDAVPGTRIYHMAPLSPDQIKDLFEKYMGAGQAAKTHAMIGTVHDLPGLAARPIMARFISEVAGQLIQRFEAGQAVNMAAIYEDLFALNLQRDAEKRPMLKPQDREDLLIALAQHLHCNALGSLRADDLERWFDRFAQTHNGLLFLARSSHHSIRDLLHVELENASLLIRDQNDCFRFAHTSFYEYFLARSFDSIESEEEAERLCKRRPSQETRDFLWSIAERDNRVEQVRSTWTARLRSESSSVPLRTFAFDFLKMQDGWQFPHQANCAGLDLRHLEISRSNHLKGVSFSGAQLNYLTAQDVIFDDCDFEGANLADAQFRGCQLINASGMPRGLNYARGMDTELPNLWRTEIKTWDSNWDSARLMIGRDLLLSRYFGSANFSPNGAQVVTASNDGTARLWDVTTGEEIKAFKGHGDWVQSASFSPDGAQVVTASDDGTARLWDVTTGEEIKAFKGHEDWVRSASFSPDGAQVVTASHDATARLWDVTTGEEIKAFKGHGSRVVSASFCPDGAQVVTASHDGTARLWDVTTGEEIKAFKGHESGVVSASFSPDGAQVVTASYDGTARLWDVTTGEEIKAFKGHGSRVVSASFSPDGAQVVTASYDGTARLWDVTTGEEIKAFKGHGDWVRSASFSPDGAQVVTASDDGTARLWDVTTGEEIKAFKGHGRWVVSASFSPDGAQVVTASYDGTARLWDVTTGEEIKAFKGHGDWVRSASFSPDGAQVVTASYDGTARLWDVTTGEEIKAFKGHGRWVVSASFSPDGAQVVTASDDGTARLWDVTTGEEIKAFKGHGSRVVSASFSPDGAQVVTASDDGTARLWDVTTGEEIKAFKGHESGVVSASFSPDGVQVVTASHDGTARLWDVTTGEEIKAFIGHESGVVSASFSPDGAQVVTASHDGTARLWDVTKGEEIKAFKGHGRWVVSASFSPDGAQVVTASDDGTARLWNVDTGKESARYAHLAGSWASLDLAGKIIKHAPNIWRYVN